MAKQRETSQTLGDFPGYINNIDPNNLPPGAGHDQVNLQSRTPGNLRTRKGFLPVTFAHQTTVPVGPDS